MQGGGFLLFFVFGIFFGQFLFVKFAAFFITRNATRKTGTIFGFNAK
jgi:hypothetical protein